MNTLQDFSQPVRPHQTWMVRNKTRSRLKSTGQVQVLALGEKDGEGAALVERTYPFGRTRTRKTWITWQVLRRDYRLQYEQETLT